MRTHAAWIVGLTLTGSSVACSPATNGLGEIGDSGEDSADDLEPGDDEQTEMEVGYDADEDPTGDEQPSGDGDGDGDGGEGDGDGDELPMQTCMDPPHGAEIDIKMFGPYFAVDDCSEPIISARVQTVEGGSYGLTACACGDPECSGDDLQLEITLPDPAWLPQLELGTCYYFHTFAEEVSPGECRRNRIDISVEKDEAPWYSAGSASEDLEHNGISIAPVVADACTDDCGEWQVRDVTFMAHETQQTLSWGEDAWVGGYKAVNWQSYATPNGCGDPSVDITAWTVK